MIITFFCKVDLQQLKSNTQIYSSLKVRQKLRILNVCSKS